ncbi:autotransporter outer membrane beta-barrel domain-containing protein [Pseudomonas sp. BMS12]|uniref:autotransporter outer membrane beta-barrel domain-containing protein n=1 Tax=Pseudomonas sp. BMS12 TaxID=1796033 RepID=UPI00083A27E3|nr:autotransporter outer membrane beta-barrel domain-containing protein [Pseudomonas sp. BMS12]
MKLRTTLCALLLAVPAVQADELLLNQRALLLDDARLPREAALDRLQQVRFAFREAAAEDGEWPLWARAYGQHGSWDGGMERDGEGLLLGLDRALGGQWVAGALLGTSRSRLDQGAAHSHDDSQYLGVYAATRVYYQLGFKLGFIHGWHDLEHGSARSQQVFGESSFALDFRDFTLEPFAGLALQRLDAGSTRGAGLRLPGADEEAGYLSLGWRLTAPWYLGARKWVGHASLALRQDLGSDSLNSRAWSEQGEPLSLSSREFERSTLRLDLSLDHELSRQLYLGLTYAGQYADDARDNALAARLSLKF